MCTNNIKNQDPKNLVNIWEDICVDICVLGGERECIWVFCIKVLYEEIALLPCMETLMWFVTEKVLDVCEGCVFVSYVWRCSH